MKFAARRMSLNKKKLWEKIRKENFNLLLLKKGPRQKTQSSTEKQKLLRNKVIISKWYFLRWDHLFTTYANSPKSCHFLTPDTRTYVCLSGDKKCLFFGNFAYVLNKWSLKWNLLTSPQMQMKLSRVKKLTLVLDWTTERFYLKKSMV